MQVDILDKYITMAFFSSPIFVRVVVVFNRRNVNAIVDILRKAQVT